MSTAPPAPCPPPPVSLPGLLSPRLTSTAPSAPYLPPCEVFCLLGSWAPCQPPKSTQHEEPRLCHALKKRISQPPSQGYNIPFHGFLRFQGLLPAPCQVFCLLGSCPLRPQPPVSPLPACRLRPQLPVRDILFAGLTSTAPSAPYLPPCQVFCLLGL